MIGFQRSDARQIDFIVANDFDVFAQLAEVLHEVVGEAVIVIDHQKHGGSFGVMAPWQSDSLCKERGIIAVRHASPAKKRAPEGA